VCNNASFLSFFLSFCVCVLRLWPNFLQRSRAWTGFSARGWS
jgi:hypothetical protein